MPQPREPPGPVNPALEYSGTRSKGRLRSDITPSVKTSPAGDRRNSFPFTNRTIRSAPRVSESRALTPAEASSLYHFETHARECVHCYDPLTVYLERRALCADGQALAQDVASHVYYRAGEIYSCQEEDGMPMRVEVSSTYGQLRLLLKAMGRASKDISRTIPFIRYDTTSTPDNDGAATINDKKVAADERGSLHKMDMQTDIEYGIKTVEPDQQFRRRRRVHKPRTLKDFDHGDDDDAVTEQPPPKSLSEPQSEQGREPGIAILLDHLSGNRHVSYSGTDTQNQASAESAVSPGSPLIVPSVTTPGAATVTTPEAGSASQSQHRFPKTSYQSAQHMHADPSFVQLAGPFSSKEEKPHELLPGNGNLGQQGLVDGEGDEVERTDPLREIEESTDEFLNDLDANYDFQISELDAVETTAYDHTNLDSGYHSTDKPENATMPLERMTEDDDAASVMTDNRESSLLTATKKRLESVFAHGLFRDLDMRSPNQNFDVQQMIASLRDSLRDFSIILGARANSVTEQNAVSFVRHSRTRICAGLMNELSEAAKRAELHGGSGMTPQEKFARWNADLSSREGLKPPELGKDNLAEDDSEFDFDISDIPNGPESQKFLFEGAEYTWLLQRVRNAASELTKDGPQQVIKSFVDALAKTDSRRNTMDLCLTVDMAWSPTNFCLEQFADSEEPVDLTSIIVLTGTANQPRASTCGQYITQMWPTNGKAILACIQDATTSSFGSTKLEVICTESNTRVKSKGTALALLEVFEVLAFLGTACRASTAPDEFRYCTPILSIIEPFGGLSFHVDFLMSELEPGRDLEADCWQQMFRNPVIAKGYPTKQRKDVESGLEVGREMMAVLSQAPQFAEFAGRVMLKGFNSILAPIERIGNSIKWHFLANKNRKRLSYRVGRQYSMFSSFDDVFFEGARHFVGWNRSAEIVAGT